MLASALLAGLLFPLVLVAILIFVVNGFRNDSDAAGHRAYSVFLATASYVALIVLLIGMYSAVAGVAHLARAHNDAAQQSSSGSSALSRLNGSGNYSTSSGTHFAKNPQSDKAWRDIVDGLIVSGIAGGIYWWHRKRINVVRSENGFANSPSERVMMAQAYLVCFTALVIFIAGAAGTVHSIFQLFSPVIFDAVDRGAGAANFSRNVFLVLEATGVFILYRPGTQLFSPKAADSGASGTG